jgi:hypothetical protein
MIFDNKMKLCQKKMGRITFGPFHDHLCKNIQYFNFLPISLNALFALYLII